MIFRKTAEFFFKKIRDRDPSRPKTEGRVAPEFRRKSKNRDWRRIESERGPGGARKFFWVSLRSRRRVLIFWNFSLGSNFFLKIAKYATGGGAKIGNWGILLFFLTLIFWPAGFFCVSSSKSGSQKIGGVLWVGKKILKKWFFEIRSNFFLKWKSKVDFFGGRKNWKNRFLMKFRKWAGGRRRWPWGSENGLEGVQTRFFGQNDSFRAKIEISIFFRFSSRTTKSFVASCCRPPWGAGAEVAGGKATEYRHFPFFCEHSNKIARSEILFCAFKKIARSARPVFAVDFTYRA